MANSMLKGLSTGIGNALGWLAKNRVELENNDLAMARQASMAMFSDQLATERAKAMDEYSWGKEKERAPEKLQMKINEATKVAEADQSIKASLLGNETQKIIDSYADRRAQELGTIQNKLAVDKEKLLSPLEIEKQKKIAQNSAEIQLQKQKDFAKYTLDQLPATEKAKAKAELEAEQAKIQAQAEATWPSVAKRLGVDASNEGEKKLYVSEAIADYNVKKLYPNTELTGANLIQIQKEAQDAYEKTKTAYDATNGDGTYDKLHPNAVQRLTTSMVNELDDKLKSRIGGTYSENRPLSPEKTQSLINQYLNMPIDKQKKALDDPNISESIKSAIRSNFKSNGAGGKVVETPEQQVKRSMLYEKQQESKKNLEKQWNDAALLFKQKYGYLPDPRLTISDIEDKL